jgi:hypothetical protein
VRLELVDLKDTFERRSLVIFLFFLIFIFLSARTLLSDKALRYTRIINTCVYDIYMRICVYNIYMWNGGWVGGWVNGCVCV